MSVKFLTILLFVYFIFRNQVRPSRQRKGYAVGLRPAKLKLRIVKRQTMSQNKEKSPSVVTLFCSSKWAEPAAQAFLPPMLRTCYSSSAQSLLLSRPFEYRASYTRSVKRPVNCRFCHSFNLVKLLRGSRKNQYAHTEPETQTKMRLQT